MSKPYTFAQAYMAGLNKRAELHFPGVTTTLSNDPTSLSLITPEEIASSRDLMNSGPVKLQLPVADPMEGASGSDLLDSKGPVNLQLGGPGYDIGPDPKKPWLSNTTLGLGALAALTAGGGYLAYRHNKKKEKEEEEARLRGSRKLSSFSAAYIAGTRGESAPVRTFMDYYMAGIEKTAEWPAAANGAMNGNDSMDGSLLDAVRRTSPQKGTTQPPTIKDRVIGAGNKVKEVVKDEAGLMKKTVKEVVKDQAGLMKKTYGPAVNTVARAGASSTALGGGMLQKAVPRPAPRQ